MSKHRKATRPVRTKVQSDRLANISLDAPLLRDLMLRLWAALPPGAALAGGEKLGKVGKRSASPANLNIDAHDLLVDIVTGLTDLGLRAREQLDDQTPAGHATAAALAAVEFAKLPTHLQCAEVLEFMRNRAWSDAYMAAWTKAQRPRRHVAFRAAYTTLGRLPDLVDRLHGQANQPTAERIAQRIARDLDRWVSSAQLLLGMLDRDTYEIERRCPERGFVREEDGVQVPDCNGVIRVNRTNGTAKCTNRGWHAVTMISGEWDDRTWRKLVKPDVQETA